MRYARYMPRAFGVMLTLVVAMMAPASAQEAQSAEQTAPADAAPAETPTEGRGLFSELGRLIKSPADLFPSLAGPAAKPEPAQDIRSVAPPPPRPPVISAEPGPEPPAAAMSTRLFPGMAMGREVCPRSANGAPDCQAGADKLCQSKGYKGGKSLNMDSAFTCSVRQARAEGRKPCGTEHFVTSAFCN